MTREGKTKREYLLVFSIELGKEVHPTIPRALLVRHLSLDTGFKNSSLLFSIPSLSLLSNATSDSHGGPKN